MAKYSQSNCRGAATGLPEGLRMLPESLNYMPVTIENPGTPTKVPGNPYLLPISEGNANEDNGSRLRPDQGRSP
jgi:hypothetical protein